MISEMSFQMSKFLKENLYITGRNFSEITDNEFAQLSSIAKNTDGYSAGIAKNILSFHYNMFFDDRELELPHENIKLCDYDIENEKTKMLLFIDNMIVFTGKS